jgi:HD-like signal output (HDOD) protein/ActR/RegA family two-component response regulator
VRKIIFVDDAPEILHHLRRTLAGMSAEWDMQFYQSGGPALASIKTSGCDVVVSDMIMPEMDGAKLLQDVQQVSPHAIRIILSGDSSPYNHVRSATVAHRFLQKPFDVAALKLTIRQAEALRTLLENPALRGLVKEIKTLPSLPSIYQDLMQEMQSPQSSLKKAARIVGKDLAMATKILQLVNSAFFGLRTHVSNPEQAVALLGFDAVKSLVLSMQVFSQFDQATLPAFSLDDLWRHAVLASTCARRIAKEEGVNQHVLEEAYTAALLHDIGVLILASNRPDEYRRVLELMQSKGIPDWEAERAVFGSDHAQVGAYLLGLWGLSDGIVEAVAFHHHPSDHVAPGFTAVTAVHIGNAIAEATRADSADQAGSLTFDRAYAEREHLLPRLPRWCELCAAA